MLHAYNSRVRREIWIGLVEVRPQPACEMITGKGAFTHVLAWATSEDVFRQKVKKVMAEYRLDMMDIIDVEPFASRINRCDVADELHEIADEMLQQPNAVRYATFYNWMKDE